MRLSGFLTFASVLALLFGLGFLFAPAAVLAQYGVEGTATIVLMTRFFAAALLQIGVLLWIGRRIEDPPARRMIVVSGFVGSIIGGAVALAGVLAHTVNTLGWSSVAIYVIFVLGYGYFLMA
jgi:hypothetical protein